MDHHHRGGRVRNLEFGGYSTDANLMCGIFQAKHWMSDSSQVFSANM